MQSVEGRIEMDANSGDEKSEDRRHRTELNELDISGVDFLLLVEEINFWLKCKLHPLTLTKTKFRSLTLLLFI